MFKSILFKLFCLTPFKTIWADDFVDTKTLKQSRKSESELMQDQLEPIYHTTQHDESDDIEAVKNSS